MSAWQVPGRKSAGPDHESACYNMIKTLIIEDEQPAAERLARMLVAIEPSIEILDMLDSVEASVRWLDANPRPDLIMLDIQLADGLSFDIFKQTRVDSFVIFTTAYDEYAIKAFELNSIDFLLKPVDRSKFEQSPSQKLGSKGIDHKVKIALDRIVKRCRQSGRRSVRAIN